MEVPAVFICEWLRLREVKWPPGDAQPGRVLVLEPVSPKASAVTHRALCSLAGSRAVSALVLWPTGCWTRCTTGRPPEQTSGDPVASPPRQPHSCYRPHPEDPIPRGQSGGWRSGWHTQKELEAWGSSPGGAHF